MKKGEIFKGTNRKQEAAYHPIVYLENYRGNSFVGAVLTHSEEQGNTLMEKGHFKEVDAEGKKYEINFDNTHLVINRFIKPEEWGPYIKIGELTEEGIKFVELITSGHKAESWEEYIGE
jgi:hypothetical protein